MIRNYARLRDCDLEVSGNGKSMEMSRFLLFSEFDGLFAPLSGIVLTKVH